MITVIDRERIRRAYFVENKSIRAIAREFGHSRDTVRLALESAEAPTYTLHQPRPASVLGEHKELLDQLLTENESLPRKQRYTTHKIFLAAQAAGYAGCESGVRGYLAQRRREQKRPQVFLPLEFDPGQDAQVDWGEAVAAIAGQRVTVQMFVMRLNYSRRVLVRAYPTQNQVAFFDGHVQAFGHFQGVPQHIAYDNLKVAVQQILTGHTRQEQERFVVFRSHYLFESRFCTPGQGHEKGGVESAVGFARRNFLVPIPEVASFEALNAYLLAACRADDQRRVAGQALPIGQAWELERPKLRPLPARAFDCCLSKPVSLTPYSQVEFETNRYSVPADQVYAHLVLKAYPFRVQILHGDTTLAEHPRCYGQHQDIFDPLHYLPLVEQRPGAFEHAKPIRQWRQHWPPVYEQLLARLKAEAADRQGIREFVQILKLHRDHPAALIEQAIAQALQFGCVHADGVQLCLHQLLHPAEAPPLLNLADRPQLVQVGSQPLDLHCYEQLLGRGAG